MATFGRPSYSGKFVIYETKSRFFLVGSHSSESRYHVMKIDRTQGNELKIDYDTHQYSQKEIKDVLSMIDHGNRDGSQGLSRNISAFGIVGFVKFLEGYYVVVITKRRKIALLGQHYIYKIEETQMIYIPNCTTRNANEQKYVKIFQSVDLANNFYFSYSYNLSQTLQHNLCSDDFSVRYFADKFVWNYDLWPEELIERNSKWFLPITHGFVSQAPVNIFGRSVMVSLIARRSRQFAGARFLKRGANSSGHVANEVETEQIVYDASVLLLERTEVTSYVQLRGSLPLMWSQDTAKVVKPPISIDQSDPYGHIAGLHFSQLLRRYGSPAVVFNLVKRRERRPHESILTRELSDVILQLNQFLPGDQAIKYIGFDMARLNKKKDENVLKRLEEVSKSCIKITGFFQHNHAAWKLLHRQHGVVRTNCVDCLDRTNTAQFALGKSAIAHQLVAIGVLDKPVLESNCDCIRLLEELYEDQGDTLAIQYGGSQLVHRIKEYRKEAHWTASSRDIMQTMSRYYSNNFSDSEKQNAFNVFLGVFQAQKLLTHVWELPTDYYLHNSAAREARNKTHRTTPFTEWVSRDVISYLPYPSNERDVVVGCNRAWHDYNEYYRTRELTSLDELFAFSICNNSRTNAAYNECLSGKNPTKKARSPFQTHDEQHHTLSWFGKWSHTDSRPQKEDQKSDESGSESDSSVITWDLSEEESLHPVAMKKRHAPKLADLFQNMQLTYGCDIKPVAPADASLYDRYANGQIVTRAAQFQKSWIPKVSAQQRAIYDAHISTGQYGPNLLARKTKLGYTKYLSVNYF